MDFIDFEDKTIYELKPYNPRQIKNGTKQLENYLKEIEDIYGDGWTTVLDTYWLEYIMDNKEFKKILRISLEKEGFTYKNKSFYKDNNDLIIVVDLQKSNF